MTKRILMMVLLLAASVGYAWPEVVGPWEITKGAEDVLVFQPEYIPYAVYFWSFAQAGHPDEIFVSPQHPDFQGGSRELWRPQGKPLGVYVYVLDLKAGSLKLMPWEHFLELDVGKETFFTKLISAYPDLNYAGDPTEFYYVIPIQKQGQELVAAASLDGKAEQKTTFGMPSIIPFMGRQKWLEKETYYSGTIILEVFDKAKPLTPIVQLKKSVRNLEDLPEVDHMAVWTQGAEQPLLVIVERGNSMRQ